jgi:Spy/CpxP family protein refolding chaperone
MKRNRVLATVVLLGIVGVTGVLAQGGGGGGMPFGLGMGGGMGWSDLEQKQYRAFNQALGDLWVPITKLTTNLTAVQAELAQATMADPFDEKAVAAIAETIGRLQADLMVLRAQALATIAPTLRRDQRAELQDGPAGPTALTSGFLNIFGLGGFGGGPGGFGGGPGGFGGGPGGFGGGPGVVWSMDPGPGFAPGGGGAGTFTLRFDGGGGATTNVVINRTNISIRFSGDGSSLKLQTDPAPPNRDGGQRDTRPIPPGNPRNN